MEHDIRWWGVAMKRIFTFVFINFWLFGASFAEVSNNESTNEKILKLIKQLPQNPANAGFWLGESFGLKPLPYLIEPLKTGNSKVKIGVYESLFLMIWKKFRKDKPLPWTEEINYSLLSENIQNALKEAIEIAIKDSIEHSDCNVRKRAIHFLGLIGGSRVISVLKGFLKESNLSIRTTAVYTLSQLGEKYDLFEVLTGKKPKTPEEYATYLNDKYLYLPAMKELMKFGKESIPALLKLAKENKEPARQRAIALLGQLKAEEAIPVFVNYLKEKTKDETIKDLQISCINALSTMGIEKTKDIIVKYGLNNKNCEVQLISARFLIKTERDEVMKTLKKMLKRKNPQLKLEIAKLLLENREKEGIDVLIELLKNPRVSGQARIYLENTTGKDFGRLPKGIITKKMLEEYIEKWESWWEENKDTFKFPEDNSNHKN